jgi:hypothetical protein
MNRRAFLLLPIVTISGLTQTQNSNLVQDSMNFNDAFGIFFRKLLGCSEHETDVSYCHPQVGEINYSAFRKCRELAKKLFVLEEKHP